MWVLLCALLAPSWDKQDAGGRPGPPKLSTPSIQGLCLRRAQRPAVLRRPRATSRGDVGRRRGPATHVARRGGGVPAPRGPRINHPVSDPRLRRREKRTCSSLFRAPGLGWSGPYPAPHFTGREEAQPPGRPDIVDRRPAGPWDDWSAGVPPIPWSAGVDRENPGLVPTVSRTAARGDFSESGPPPVQPRPATRPGPMNGPSRCAGERPGPAFPLRHLLAQRPGVRPCLRPRGGRHLNGPVSARRSLDFRGLPDHLGGSGP